MFTTLSAMVVAVSMTLPSASVFAASYSQELQDAYNWAHEKGVTTMSSIDNANMYGAITRAEMAKMLSVYATEVLEKEADTSAACTFTDIASLKNSDLHDYVIESCQLGIMGQNMPRNEFRPYDTISRAEFGTALSRVLWGDKYEGGTPYYANHLNALKAAAIMNQIADAESTKEIRGYVMLMLMRSEGNDAVVDCEDADVMLACLDPEGEAYKNCPAACREDANSETNEDGEVVKSGDLAVTASPASERKAIIGAVSDLDTLKFKTSEEVTISKIVLERYGYSKGADVEKVWLEDEDGNEITTRKAINSRDQVELSFKKDYKTVDGSVNATIVVKLADSVTTGGTIGFKVISAESTAKNQELDKSWYTPYTYDMVGYDAVKVSIDAKGSDKDYNYEEWTMYEVAKFKLKANTSPLVVNGVNLENTYTGEKNLDMKDFLDKVEVLVNGEKVDWVKFTVEKKNKLNISFDSVDVAAKENATFTVNVALAGFDEYGAGVRFAVTAESDVKIQEKKTWARVSVALPENPEWAQHKFVWSKIKLSNKKLWNVEYAAGSSDVVVAEGTITLAESVELADKTFVVKAIYSTWYDIIEEMKLVIAGEEFDVDKSYTKGATWATFTFNDIVIEKGGKVQIKVDLDRDAPDAATVTFDGAFDETSFANATYPDGDDSKVQPDEISGTIWFASRLTVQASKASLSNDSKTDAEFKDNETSEEIEVLKWKYTSKKGDVSLTDFTVEAASGLDLKSSTVTFYLYIDGSKTSVADIRLKGTTAKGTDSFPNVKVKAGESVDVLVTAEVNAKGLIEGTGSEKELGKFTVTLAWEDDEGNTAWKASRKTVDLTVVKAGSIVVDNTSKEKTLLLAKSQLELASLNVKPDGAATDLETLVFTLSWVTVDTATIDDVLKVEIDGNDIVEDNYCTVDGNTVTCNGMAERIDSKANITISLEEEDAAQWDIELTVTQINNDKSVNKTFKKKFVGVLVTFTKQVFGDVSTKFTLKVDKKKSSDEANSLKIYAKAAGASACGTTPIYSGTDSISESNNPISITNTNENQVICKIEYNVKNGDPVSITKDEFPDYFDKIPTEGSKSSTEELVVRKTTD